MPIGYQGFAKLASTGSGDFPMLVLANTAGLNVEASPIFSEATIGQGWRNAAMNTHYAEGAIIYRGTVDFELEGYDNMLTYIRDWALHERAYARSVDISSDGKIVYEHRNAGDDGAGPCNWIYAHTDEDGVARVADRGGVWCESLALNAAEGSAVTCSVGGVSLARTIQTGTVGGVGGLTYIENISGSSGLTPAYPLNPSQDNLYPIPFWKTLGALYTNCSTPVASLPRTVVGATQIQSVNTICMSWDLSLSNNTLVVYYCGGSQTNSAIVLQGGMEVTGTLTLYDDAGIETDLDNHSGDSAENTCVHITIPGTNYVIQIPYVAYETSEYGLRGKNEAVSRTFSVRGLGDGTLPNMHITPA